MKDPKWKRVNIVFDSYEIYPQQEQIKDVQRAIYAETTIAGKILFGGTNAVKRTQTKKSDKISS